MARGGLLGLLWVQDLGFPRANAAAERNVLQGTKRAKAGVTQGRVRCFPLAAACIRAAMRTQTMMRAVLLLPMAHRQRGGIP